MRTSTAILMTSCSFTIMATGALIARALGVAFGALG